MDKKKIDREGGMWQILNVITPSKKGRIREDLPAYLFPLSDEIINAVFPSRPKRAEDEKEGGQAKSGAPKKQESK